MHGQNYHQAWSSRRHLSCPWLPCDKYVLAVVQVIETAHEVGLPTTSTIMFGHVDGPRVWARHLLAIRALQRRTGGITEFVPLPFVHMEAPIYLKGTPQGFGMYWQCLFGHKVVQMLRKASM